MPLEAINVCGMLGLKSMLPCFKTSAPHSDGEVGNVVAVVMCRMTHTNSSLYIILYELSFTAVLHPLTLIC